MSPELYRSAFDAMPWDERPEQIRSGCEACILSVIGGAPIMLLDLHNSALSREKKDAKRKPAIMRFTDHWLNHNGVKPPEKFFEIMKQIKTVRRAQLEARRARRDQRKRGTLKTNEFSAQSDVGNLGFTFADKPARKQFEDEEIAEGGEELIGIFYTDKLAHGNNRDICERRSIKRWIF
ncbi:hypothetical protein M7I_2110 [Glarea lozoyensis 74030]|uniref:Uncharacterized protein n=1 Tax=Glarea lozoyensis (strain ATCC 74030 / MF5533) TaxID=1104152 RepID=H0EHW8_GLAL7|nr:hypothetical protein M7I_2110 [Glarea lozoyensis 74030]